MGLALDINLVLDLLLTGLLVATVIYCFVLNRRLSALRNARGDMAEMVRSFHHATEAARSSVDELKVASAAIGQDLQDRLQKGRDMVDELELVVASAGRVADRIEKGVDSNKATAPSAPASGGAPDLRVRQGGRSEPERTDAERELLQALREVR